MDYTTHNLTRALQAASRAARLTETFRYVVQEDGEYAVAAERDLSTYFAGARIVATFGPAGLREETA